MRKFHKINLEMLAAQWPNVNPDNIVLPTRATENSACYDLYSAEGAIIRPGESVLIPTGVKIELLPDEALFIFNRSGLSTKEGIVLTNAVGVIDADYFENETNDGHILVSLTNTTTETYMVPIKMRIAQAAIMKYYVTADDDASGKRAGGLGSTGK